MPGPHGRLRTGLPVAVGLGLLLLALAGLTGCTQASPPLSSSQEPVADPGIATAGETPEPPVDGDTTQTDTGQAAAVPVQVPRVTIETLTVYVTEGEALRVRLRATPNPATELTVNLRWSGPAGIFAAPPPSTVKIPTSPDVDNDPDTDDDFATVDISATTAAEVVKEGGSASVWVLLGTGVGYTGAHTGVGVQVRDKVALPFVSITAQPLEVNEGDPFTFTLTAKPPPRHDLTVNLVWHDEDLGRLAQAPPRTIKLPASVKSVSVSVPTKDDLIDNYGSDHVGFLVWSGNGYGIGSPATATVTVVDDEYTPHVSVSVQSSSVVEGDDLSFTLTADPAPAFDLTVSLSWDVHAHIYGGPRVPHQIADTPNSVTIPTSGTATVALATTDDDIIMLPTTVTMTILQGDHYFAPYATNEASITIKDNDWLER